MQTLALDSTTNSPAVFVRLTDYGASNMLNTTQSNIGKRMAVVFVEKDNEKVINIAVIREAFSQSFQITGLDMNEAKGLAILPKIWCSPSTDGDSRRRTVRTKFRKR